MTKQEINNILKEHKSGSGTDLRGTDLSRTDLRGADLSRADLSGANLNGANFSGADLSGTDLSRADLNGANFSGANFSGANLWRANLWRANFSGVNFSGANFSGVNFSETNLSRADLNGANFSGAKFNGANLNGANFSGAKLDFKFKRKLVSNRFLMNKMFKRSKNGWIAYKTFGSQYESPKKWQIKNGKTIKDHIDTNRFVTCSYGINVATLEWVKINNNSFSGANAYTILDFKFKFGDIWKVEIPFTSEICVPIYTDGKVRVSEAKLIEIVN